MIAIIHSLHEEKSCQSFIIAQRRKDRKEEAFSPAPAPAEKKREKLFFFFFAFFAPLREKILSTCHPPP
jgi:hypothetical protein